MRIYFNDSLCKRCPLQTVLPCDYRKDFFGKFPEKPGRFSFVHKCQHYKNIFRKGQMVLVDLYHHVPGARREWECVPAYKNVPGIVLGCRGSKFRIELLEAVFLMTREKGDRNKTKERLFLYCTRTALEVTPLTVDKGFMRTLLPLVVSPDTVCETAFN